VNDARLLKDDIRAGRHGSGDLDDPLAQSQDIVSPVDRQDEDANGSARKILLGEHASVRRNQQIEPSLHFRKQPTVLDILPADIAVIDRLARCPRKAAFNWTGMFSSSRILNATHP